MNIPHAADRRKQNIPATGSILFGLCLAMLAGHVMAASAAEDIEVSGAWVRSVPPVTPTTAAYFRLRNRGTEPHLLTGVSSDAAGNIEIHNHDQVDGMMRMRRIPHVHIPGKSSAELAPGGMHLMIFRLRQPLRPGESLPLQLRFADGSRIPVAAEVK